MNNRAQGTIRVLLLGASIAAGFPAASRAQSPESQQPGVLKSALESFQSSTFRNRATAARVSSLYQQSPSKAWFNGYKGSAEKTVSSLEAISGAQNVAIGKPNRFSLAGKAQPGDIVHVQWTSKGKVRQALLIYVGQDSFPGEKTKQSFFIYPYRTQLEHNTIPPRKHKQYLLEMGSVPNEQLEKIYHFGPPDTKRSTEWVKAGGILSRTRLRTSLLNGTGKYSLYRGEAQTTGMLAGSFDGTRYEITNGKTKIKITFDPNQSSKVGSAERISHIQVVSLQIDGKPAPLWKYLLQSSSPSSKIAGRHYKDFTTANGHFVDKGILFFELIWEKWLKDKDNLKASDTRQYSILKADVSRWKSPALQPFGDTSQIGYKTGTASKPAIIADDPSFDDNDSKTKVVLRFENWSWCEKGADLGKWYNGLIYEMTWPKEATSPKLNMVQTDLPKPSSSFLEAFQLHNQHFNYKVSNQLTYSEAVQLFKYLRTAEYQKVLLKEPINFDSIDELIGGCQYRAQAMWLFIKKKHPRLKVRKIFSIASGFPNKATLTPRKNGKTIQFQNNNKKETLHWGFHVAPIIRVEGQDFVFDPSFFDRPVSIKKWLQAQPDDQGGEPRTIITEPKSTVQESPYIPRQVSPKVIWRYYQE